MFELEDQELRVSRQDLSDGIDKLPSRLDPLADLVSPGRGDVHDVFDPRDHKRERPRGMTLPTCTVARGFPTAEMTERQGARQQIVGDGEPAHQGELALPEPRDLQTLRIAVLAHLIVIIP